MFSEQTKKELKNKIKKRFKRSYKLYVKFITRNNFNYKKWIKKHEANIKDVSPLEYNPKFSVVVPVYNTIDKQLKECIESVLSQTYNNYELILVDDHSSWDSVRVTLSKYEDNSQVKVIYRSENGNISVATNDGIDIATGDYIVFMDCDDVISVNALYEFAKLLNKNKDLDFIYSDEDKLSEDGKHRLDPFFKPDWSPDTFMCMMYTSHLSTYRTKIVKEVGGLRTEYNGSQDYDFTMRFMEHTDNKKVGHIPKILYHWRQRKESTASDLSAKPYALIAMEKLKKDALNRRGLTGEVQFFEPMRQYRVVYHNDNNPLVSIIIPSKDNYDILMQCLNSIWDNTSYENYEIILVDNGSAEETRTKLKALADAGKIRYVYEKKDFNFSYMCNQGAEAAKGDYYLLLNDDIEICQNDWLDIMVGQTSLSHVGAVGAKLYYPNSNLIQHAGVINLPVGPSHSLLKEADDKEFYYGRNYMNYNMIAVTGACLLVSKDKYLEVGMMDESLPVAYNDIDLCFALYEHGYYNVIRNDVQLFHHESVSRGYDTISEEKMQRLERERNYLYKKHPDLDGKDPFYNPNLPPNRGDYVLQN